MKKYVLITVCMIVAITSSLLVVRYIDNRSRTRTMTYTYAEILEQEKIRREEQKQRKEQEWQAWKDRIIPRVYEFNNNHKPQ